MQGRNSDGGIGNAAMNFIWVFETLEQLGMLGVIMPNVKNLRIGIVRL